MQKTLFTLLLMVASLGANAQATNTDVKTYQELLTFKGIQLSPGIKIDDFFAQLQTKGLKKTSICDIMHESYGGYDLEGIVNNYHNCNIKLLPLNSDQSILSMIGISFPNQTSFKELYEQYSSLKNSLSKKYYIYSSEEKFDDSYVQKTTSDYLKIEALKDNECIFKTIFYVSDSDLAVVWGQVVLSISHISVDYKDLYYVSLSYCTPDNIYEQIQGNDDL